MSPERLKAFTDGVLAIIITIMVLELRAPHDATLASLRPLLPAASSYVLSFVYLAIYWSNHHHLLHATRRVTGGILWANMHLLFWLSLVPFVTAWMSENRFAPVTLAAYGAVLFLAALAYWLLERTIIGRQSPGSIVEAAVGSDLKVRLSPLAYAIAIPSAFVEPWIAGAIYVGVALVWLVPERRIERLMAAGERTARDDGEADAPRRDRAAATPPFDQVP